MSAEVSIVQADCLEFLAGLKADSADLVFGSPPYELARTYGIDFDLKGQAWVDWMVKVYQASLRVCTGLVAFVLEGQTKGFRYTATPALLMADLHRAGVCLRKPPIFHRVGIPGSGGPDWLRNDYEFIICATRGGKLPWSDNTAAGHPPKWAPGGAMSHRISDGTRRNQWGGNEKSGSVRKASGERQPPGRPSHVLAKKRRVVRGTADGDTATEDAYLPPVLANPGNVIHMAVGGNQLGSNLAHDNEAPFPEKLAEFFVQSFCPPGGTVCDVFSGSGTTAAVAKRHNRNFVGCDIRQSQVELGLKRVSEVTPMFAEMS